MAFTVGFKSFTTDHGSGTSAILVLAALEPRFLRFRNDEPNCSPALPGGSSFENGDRFIEVYGFVLWNGAQ